jgi:cell division protein FtsX
MKLQKQKHTIDILFVLTLFLLFVIITLLILMMGANTYKNVSSTVTARYNETTCMSYIANKVRSYDENGEVYISKINNIPSLMLKQTIDDETYLTYLYAYEGKLMELNCMENDISVTADSGSAIVDLSELQMQYVTPNLLYFKAIYSNSSENELFLYVHSTQ